MLRFIFLFIFSYTSLFASYTEVLSYYQKGQFQKAIKKAKHSKKDYSNPNLHLIWGRSAKKLGLNNEAMSAYERVLMLNPNNKEAQQVLRDIYKITHRDELLEKMSSSDTYIFAGRGMQNHHKKPLPKNIKTTFSLSMGYDNNLNATPGSDVLSDYFGTFTKTDQVSSLFSRMTASISHSRNIADRDDWYIKAIVRAYVQSNFSAHLYDFSNSSFEVGVGYKQNNYELYFPISYHRVHYLDKDFLEQYRFLPQVLVPIGDDIVLNISALYTKNNNLQINDQTRDEERYGIEVGTYYLFGKHYAYISSKFEHRIAQHEDSAKFVEANFFTLGMGVNYYFTPALYGKLDYSFRYGRYDDEVGLSVTTRDDNLHQLNAKLGYIFSKNSQLFISDAYSENRSNYIPSKFRKHSTVIGISFTY